MFTYTKRRTRSARYNVKGFVDLCAYYAGALFFFFLSRPTFCGWPTFNHPRRLVIDMSIGMFIREKVRSFPPSLKFIRLYKSVTRVVFIPAVRRVCIYLFIFFGVRESRKRPQILVYCEFHRSCVEKIAQKDDKTVKLTVECSLTKSIILILYIVITTYFSKKSPAVAISTAYTYQQ